MNYQVVSIGNKYLVTYYIGDVKSVVKIYNLSDGNFLFEKRIKTGAKITLTDNLITRMSKENQFFYMKIYSFIWKYILLYENQFFYMKIYSFI